MTTPTPDTAERAQALLERYQVHGPRYTSYPTAPEWSADFKAQDLGAALDRAAATPAAPLSLYVHLPFCYSLCWYCGCNIVVSKERGAADVYLDHLALELDAIARRLGDRRTLSQLHWGGGTPTFLDERQLERLWREITFRFRVLPGAEVALEVHPARTTARQLEVLRALGFNRLSMGLQDFDPQVQAATNRIQTYEQTASLLEHARALGFTGVNVDLIYGLPMQTAGSWARTLEQVSTLRPDRLAIYSFAYVPEVLKHQRRMPADRMPVGQSKLGLLWAANETLVAQGYRPIGMDHFALPSDELAQAQQRRALGRNFQGYTVAAASEVIAAGASAISDVGGAYAQNVKNLTRYYARIREGLFATERGLQRSEDDHRRRQIIQDLMCNLWTDLGPDAETAFASELERLQPLEEDGLVVRRGQALEVTAAGRWYVRNVAMVFDRYLHAGTQRRFSATV